MMAARAVVNEIDARADLSKKTKREITSAWTSASAWFEISLEHLIAQHRNLRPRFARLSPGGLGVTKKRIANVKYLIRRSLALVAQNSGKSFKVPLTPSWLELEKLIDDRYLRVSVSCFFRLGSARGVLPPDVDDAFSAAVLQALMDEGLNKRPRITHQNAARAWNRLVALSPAWPQTKLAHSGDDDHAVRCMATT